MGGKGRSSFACPYAGCTKEFNRRYNIDAHIRTHTGEMPYMCCAKGCEMKFKWRSSLVNHQRYHDPKELPLKRISRVYDEAVELDGNCQGKAKRARTTGTKSVPKDEGSKYGVNNNAVEVIPGLPMSTSNEVQSPIPTITSSEVSDKPLLQDDNLEFYVEVRVNTQLHPSQRKHLLQCPHSMCNRLFNHRNYLTIHLKEH